MSPREMEAEVAPPRASSMLARGGGGGAGEAAAAAAAAAVGAAAAAAAAAAEEEEEVGRMERRPCEQLGSAGRRPEGARLMRAEAILPQRVACVCESV